jgi:tetratricopeptide (TPR) repeat protein
MAAIIGLVVGGFLAWQGAIPGIPDVRSLFGAASDEAPRPSLADRLVQQADKPAAAASHRPAPATAASSGTSTQSPRLLAAGSPAAPPARAESAAPAAAKAETEKPASAASAIHVHADTQPERVRGLLLQAYAAAGIGDARGAQALYQQAIEIDPNNGDAWNGLASLTANGGDSAGAARFYQRALEIDPGDSVAMGGLLGLQSGVDPQEVETRLRVLIARDGAQPALQAALGRLLARQSRWLDAQEAFYQAWAADPSQPDVAFNLAVALEHIRQAPAALGFYKRALDLARNHAVHFDQNAARERIAALDSASR